MYREAGTAGSWLGTEPRPRGEPGPGAKEGLSRPTVRESFNGDGQTGDTTRPWASGCVGSSSPAWLDPRADTGEAVLKNTARLILHFHRKGDLGGAARWRICTESQHPPPSVRPGGAGARGAPGSTGGTGRPYLLLLLHYVHRCALELPALQPWPEASGGKRGPPPTASSDSGQSSPALASEPRGSKHKGQRWTRCRLVGAGRAGGARGKGSGQGSR